MIAHFELRHLQHTAQSYEGNHVFFVGQGEPPLYALSIVLLDFRFTLYQIIAYPETTLSTFSIVMSIMRIYVSLSSARL
jgi:hypothetical protein